MKILLWLALAGLLAVAGCAGGGATDKDRQGGFYGGLSGGWTRP